jgi:hypothetical protein
MMKKKPTAPSLSAPSLSYTADTRLPRNVVKSNIARLSDDIQLLGEVRRAFGAKDAEDTSRDEDINAANSEAIVAKWTVFSLGSDSWWITASGIRDKLSKNP